MTDQYIRTCALTVGDPKGEALDLSELHIRFGIINGDVQTPKTANIRVYNLAPETAKRVRKEYTQVVLQAGYEGMAGVIFSGQVKQVIIGRENATDTFIDVYEEYVPVWTEDDLDADLAAMEIRMARIFDE